MDLNNIVDKIQSYRELLKKYNYIVSGSGNKPWSIRYDNIDESKVEVQGSGWTYYNTEGKEVESGLNVNELENYLNKELRGGDQ